MAQYHKACLGGTFDRMHKGHEALLHKAFEVAEHVLIGLTTDTLVHDKKLASIIQPYQIRLENLQNFLQNKQLLDRSTIVQLTDQYGPAQNDPNLEAIVVSDKTLAGAEAVNKKRAAHGLGPLAIVIASYITSADSDHLSSTRIREGQINRAGEVYRDYLLNHAPFHYPEEFREKIADPKTFGVPYRGENPLSKVFSQLDKPPVLVTVGDVITQTSLQNAIPVTIAVIDGQNKRSPITIDTSLFDNFTRYKVDNPKGFIAKHAISVIADICHSSVNAIPHGRKGTLLEINGEEDLLVIPFILLLPLQSMIWYGFPMGIVAVTVTEQKKEEMLAFLKQWQKDA